MTQQSYSARRWCQNCQEEATVCIEMWPASIEMDCTACGSRFNLPRLGPGRA